ncbi:MAG: PKD domain-containing protein [Saprospiraceae bacterium]|nr:PKD domain-containing protein [Saprospiraceae bacterium]
MQQHLLVLPSGGNVSCISAEEGNENHLIVCVSNTGLANNIFESFDRGKTWIGVEGTGVATDKRFPDISVKWVIFAPGDATKAIIATEFGVWNTQKLDGPNTVWIPPSPIFGTPLVRTEMPQYRKSDNVILAGTYGRGLWTTDAFSPLVPKMAFEKVTYLNTPVSFQNQSINAQSLLWDFGDGTTSTEENPVHSYSKIGTYPVSLKVNNISSISSYVAVLPDRPLPYQAGTIDYGGNFEGFTEQYAVDTKSGSSFDRGNSTQSGKSGVKSGANAFVLGINETYYQPNTDTRLYLSNFNMKDNGIYEFSFWAKQKLHEGTDGYVIEYSLDRGISWKTLGTAKSGWYTTTSTGTNFPDGTPFFSTNLSNYTRFALNISDLAGNENVAFRIVFKSEDTGSHAGVAIDDVEISKYSGELLTKVIDQSLKFNSSTDLIINWSTLPEYYCSKFEVELSTNGIDFKTIKTVNSTGFLTANRQNYSIKEIATTCVYFVRIKVINESLSAGYSKVFYTPLMSIKRDEQCGSGIFQIFPNPFKNFINISFTELITNTFESGII